MQVLGHWIFGHASVLFVSSQVVTDHVLKGTKFKVEVKDKSGNV